MNKFSKHPKLLKPKLSSNQFLIIKEPIKFVKSVISPSMLAFPGLSYIPASF